MLFPPAAREVTLWTLPGINTRSEEKLYPVEYSQSLAAHTLGRV